LANGRRRFTLFPTFCDATEIFCDFCSLDLQPQQALKDKNNPNQAYPKCKCHSSSITQTFEKYAVE
jgi:hypothetical protein